jgi:hypothetical protein
MRVLRCPVCNGPIESFRFDGSLIRGRCENCGTENTGTPESVCEVCDGGSVCDECPIWAHLSGPPKNRGTERYADEMPEADFYGESE